MTEAATETKMPITSIQFHSETKDDRRNKDYRRKLTVMVIFDASVSEDDLPYSNEEFKVPRLADAFHEMTPKPGDLNTWGRIGRPQGTDWSITLNFVFRAEKPSQIDSEEYCLIRLDHRVFEVDPEIKGICVALEKEGKYTPGDGMKTRIGVLVDDVLAKQRELRARMVRHEQAARVADWIAKKADEEAQKAVRFKQRLAALVAELEAEQKVQLEEMLKAGGALDKGITEHQAKAEAGEDKYDVLDPRAVETARKCADRFMPTAKPGGRFPSAAMPRDKIAITEVE